MSDLNLLETVERYIRGEMNPDERAYFENYRKDHADVDQLVVEHTLFLQQLNRFGEWKKFKQSLQAVHTDLAEAGKIQSTRLQGRARVQYLWNRYKRVSAIAASIAGITTLSITALVMLFFQPWCRHSVRRTESQIQLAGQSVKKTRQRDKPDQKEFCYPQHSLHERGYRIHG